MSRHAPGINTSSKDPTCLVSAEAIPVLYPISLVGTWGNISLVPVAYQSQYHTCLLPVKNQSWAQHQDQTLCVCFSFLFWKHNTRPDLTSRWHLQVKLNEGPAGISRAQHWVWTQDLLWSQGPRRCSSSDPSPLRRSRLFFKSTQHQYQLIYEGNEKPWYRTRLQQVCSKQYQTNTG
jgi:hypothetical protein